MKPSERALGLARLSELRAIADPLHDVDLHENVYDAGDMTFCPGCEAIVKLNKLRNEIENYTATPAGLVANSRVASMVTRLNVLLGQTLRAADMRP